MPVHKTIGGELEAKLDSLNYYYTDSARSSLRLVLRSIGRNKKILIPNFLCKIVTDTLDGEKADYGFYNIKSDLSIDWGSIGIRPYDILYVIDYFGKKHIEIGRKTGNSKIIIEDSVFLPLLGKPADVDKWIGFNSFRKILAVAEGSALQSTIKLKEELILNKEAPFVDVKYMAKDIKYSYLNLGRFKESDYLECFNKGEKLLDKQKLIYGTSMRTMHVLNKYFADLKSDNAQRRKNYEIIEKRLKSVLIPVNTVFYSFAPLSVDNRDELRKYLFNKKVFLPVHWPRVKGTQNSLYDRIISIPLHPKYTAKDMGNIASLMINFMKKHK